MKSIFARIVNQIETDRRSCFVVGIAMVGIALMITAALPDNRPFGQVPSDFIAFFLVAGNLGLGAMLAASAIIGNRKKPN